MKEYSIIISLNYKKSSTHNSFFYPHINYQSYQQAPSDKFSLPTQNRNRDFVVSSQPQNSLLESSGCQMQLLPLLLLLLLLLFKKVGGARLGESDIHPISPKTPAPQYQPIDRKKRKGKRVEDYRRDRTA